MKRSKLRGIGKDSKAENSISFERIYSNKFIAIAFCIVIFTLGIYASYNLSEDIVLNDKTYDIIRKSETSISTDPLIDKGWDVKSDVAISFLRKVGIEDINHSLILLQLASLLISLLLCYFIIQKVTSIFYVLMFTPFFVQTFLSFTDLTLLIPIFIGFILALKKHKYVISFILQCVIAYLNFYVAVFNILLLAWQYKKKAIRLYQAGFHIIPLGIFFTLAKEVIPEGKNILQFIFIDFGSPIGISLFLVILGFAWIIIEWKNNLGKYLILVVIGIGLLNMTTALFLANIILIYLASLLIDKLVEEKWVSTDLKQLSIILIFCSILFSGLGFMKYSLDQKTEISGTLEWISARTQENSTILSHPKYGYMIKYHADRRIFLDDDISIISDGEQKYKELNHMFSSRNKKEILNFFDKYGIDYILITEEMRQGLVWSRDSQGMAFVLESNPEFSKTYSDEFVELWWYNHNRDLRR